MKRIVQRILSIALTTIVMLTSIPVDIIAAQDIQPDAQETVDESTIQEIQLSITKQPENYVGAEGSTASFKIEAKGTGLKYQWQWYDNGKWLNSEQSDAKTASLSVVLEARRSGRKYRCIVSDSAGASVTSKEVTMTITEKLEITKQPENYVGAEGSTASFKIEAKGQGLKYQWQWYTGSYWADSEQANGKTNAMSIELTKNRSGRKYRCIVSDSTGASVTSKEVTMTITEKLEITKQPENYVGAEGSTASFKIEANGQGLKYQWQWYTGSYWADSEQANGKTNAMSIELTRIRSGRKYRCIVSDKTGANVTSKEVTMQIEDTSVTVTLNANGGYFNEFGKKITTKQDKADKNVAYNLPDVDPVHDGNYVFAGWYDNPECTGDKLISYRNFVEKDTTYYAKWIKGVVITFDGNGGYLFGDNTKTSTTVVVAPNAKLSYRLNVPTFEKTSKVFTGWYTDKKCTDKIRNLSDYKVGNKDVTIYAGWEDGIDVTFDANGGYFSHKDNKQVYTATYAENEQLYQHSWAPEINDPHKEFAGWYSDRACTKPVNNYEEVTKSITVYAKWEEAVTFTYKGNGGYFYSGPGNLGTNDTYICKYTKNSNIYLMSAGRDDGYKQTGWYLDAACTQEFSTSDDGRYAAVASKDTVLYAGWTKVSKIVCDANGGYFKFYYGSNAKTHTYEVDKNESINLDYSYDKPVNKNAHLAFDGWYYDKACTKAVEDTSAVTTDKDITLYAKWSDAYAITFDANGGTFGDAGENSYALYSVKKGERFSGLQEYPNKIEEDGNFATFEGWYADALFTQRVYLENYTPTKDITLYAKWEKQHTVTYHGNGGYVICGPGGANDTYTEYFTEGTEANITQTATYYGGTKAFSGWYYDKECTKKADSTITMTKNIDLYAGWEEGITITYDLKGGTVSSDQGNTSTYKVTVKKGDYISPDIRPTRSGKEFDGWYLDENYSERLGFQTHEAKENITVYAKWINLYTLSFDANGGFYDRSDEAIAKLEEREGSSVYSQPSPSNLNPRYVMAGWYYDKACTKPVDWDSYTVTGDDTFYAKWEEGYVLTLDANGGVYYDGVTTLQKIGVKKDNAYTAYVMTPENKNSRMVFKGWYTDKNTTEDNKVKDLSNFILSKDTTLYAGWEEGIKVTFDANGGYYLQPGETATRKEITVVKGAGINVMSGDYCPNYGGDKEFVGWYLDKECTKKLNVSMDYIQNGKYYYTPEKDITLYAKWGENVTVTLNANDGYFFGVGSEFIFSIEKDSNIKDYKNIKPDLYFGDSSVEADFAGWYLDAACTQKVDFDTYIAKEDVTFYAKWIRKYKITFDANGGYVELSPSRIERVSEGESIKSLENLNVGYYEPDKKQFAGWYTDLSYTEKVDFDTYQVTGDVTFYAKWVDVTSDEDDTAFVTSQSATDSSNKAITQKPTEESTTSDASTIESTEPTATPTPEVTEAPKTAVEEDQNIKSEIPDNVEEENETAEETISEQKASVQEDTVTENN